MRKTIFLSVILLFSILSFGQNPYIEGNQTPCKEVKQMYYLYCQPGVPILQMLPITWTVENTNSYTLIPGQRSDTVYITWHTACQPNQTYNLRATWLGYGSGNSLVPINVKNIPNPLISGLASVCKNSTNIEYETEGSMVNYNWNIQGGTITSGQGTYKIKVTWTTVGSNKVTVNYSNSNGCTAQSPTEYSVVVHDLPQISILGDDSVCGGTHLYTANVNSIGSYTYKWEAINGIPNWQNINGATCNIAWNTPGNGAAIVKVTSSYGCENNSEMPVVIFPTVTPNLTGNISTCVGTLNTYSTDENESDYFWEFNNGTILSGQGTNSVNMIWNSQGIHSISILYKTQTGCIASKVFDNIYVDNQPLSTISGAVDTVYMTSSSYTTESDMLNYHWNVNGGEIIGDSTLNSIEVNWSTIGTGTLSVNYDLPTGCHSTTAIKYVSISPSICMVTYDTAENKNRIYVNTVPNTFDHYNIYMLTQSVYEKIGEMSINENSYLDPTSQPLIISNSYKISVVNGAESAKSPRHTTIYLSYTIQGNVVYLHWTPYYGFEFTEYHIYKRTNSEAWNEIGSVSNSIFDATDTYTGGLVEYYIQVSPLCIPTLKNSDSDITIKSNIQKFGTNGINENTVKTLKVYPNPARETLNVDLENGVSLIEIYDMNGRILYSTETSNDKFTMSVSGYIPGLYLIKVRNSNEIYLGKFNKIN